jgi:hypothetical protein
MMEKITNWLNERFFAKKPDPQDMQKTNYLRTLRPRPNTENPPEAEPDLVEIDPEVQGSIETLGPGKNVLIRNRLVREETGTHETLKILDDSMIETGEEPGIDPYNTGGFDRSKKWDQRFRK